MKTLYLVRHAKSSWDNPGLDDRDRPLNERGLKDAPKMARRLKERDAAPGLLLSSPAVRALETCKMIAAGLGMPATAIHTDARLYHAGRRTLMEVVQSLDDKYRSVMIFGHNPGLTDFVNQLLDEDIENIPTCGVVAAELDLKHWKKASEACGSLEFFDYPKRSKHS
ncbi:MAG: histidine phosphatase family protein [Cyclobacteriaceae bacterium]|nr:histidine phosphatase family protein [Cyclobacteriaceae bacterium]